MVKSSIRVIDSKEIELESWTRLLDSTNSIHSQYCEHWYINSICKNWKVIVKGDYHSAFVFAITSKAGFNLIYQPFFSRQFSFLGTHDSEFISYVFSYLKNNYKWIRINLPFSFNQLADNNQLMNFQVLNLSESYDVIYGNYSTNAKRILKKSTDLSFKISKDVDGFIDFFKLMVGDAIGFKHSNYQHLSELIKNGFLNDSIQLFTIRQNDEVLGYACFYFHKNVINYLKGALSDKGKKYGAMYYAFNEIIQKYAAKDCIFDFGGSAIDGISSFYKKFGAKDLSYYSHEYNALPKAVKKIIAVKNKLS